MIGLRMPRSPEEAPEPDWGPNQHRFREYRLRSGHTLTVEFPGPAYHAKMGALAPTHPVVGSVAWRWVAEGQPWRPLTDEELRLAGQTKVLSEQEKAIDRGFRGILRGGGPFLFDPDADD